MLGKVWIGCQNIYILEDVTPGLVIDKKANKYMKSKIWSTLYIWKQFLLNINSDNNNKLSKLKPKSRYFNFKSWYYNPVHINISIYLYYNIMW